MPLRLLDWLFAPPPDTRLAGWLGSTVYAHRGAHSAQLAENSPGAFAAAIAAGLGIECDVRRSADGRAIVFHDATLERLTGESGAIEDMTAAAIGARHLQPGSDPIPTLRDVLAQVASQVPLLIEVKSARQRPLHDLCRAVRRDLEGYRGPVAVMSFDPRVGAWFGHKAPAILRGLVVTEEGSRTISGTLKRHFALWSSHAQFLAYDVRDLPSSFAAAQRTRGLPLLTWTVSSPQRREAAREYADAPIAEGEGLAQPTAIA